MLAILADSFRTAARLEPRSITPPRPEQRILRRKAPTETTAR